MRQMSEYQVVKFRAIDRPLSDKQLEGCDPLYALSDLNN